MQMPFGRTTFRIWATSLLLMILLILLGNAYADTAQQVVDLQTRPNVTQRMVVLTPPEPKATVILFSGGDGGLGIYPNGSLQRGNGNFLVRTRQLFAAQGFLVAVVDAPSDRQGGNWLQGFRQTSEHVADIKADIEQALQASQK